MAKIKKKVLIAEDNEEVREILAMHIESEFNVHFIYAESVKKAVEILNEDPSIDMVIAKYNFRGVVSSKIFKFIQAMNLETFFILLTDKYPSSDQWLNGFMARRDKYKYLKYPAKEEEVISLISEMLKLKRPSKREGHRRIMKQNIGMFVREKIDIFIIDDKEEYVKINDSLDLNDTAAERDFYYVTTDDYIALSMKVNEALTAKLKSDKISFVEKINIQGLVIKRIHESLTDLGLSSKEIELGGEVYTSTLGELKRSKKMADLLGKMVKHDSFTNELALMSNYLSVAIVSKTSWYSENSMKKLSQSALLQDISLGEDEYVRIQDVECEMFKELPESVQKEILNHPAASMKIIDEISEIGDFSNTIRDIVLSHHERPHCKGFPRRLDVHALSGLSCVFIIAHEFSRTILSEQLSVEVLQGLKNDLAKNYSHGRFRKPYEAFLEIFKRGVGKI